MKSRAKKLLIFLAVLGIAVSLYGRTDIGAGITFASFLVYFFKVKRNKG